MTTLSKHARVAGLLYLALILIAPVGLVVVPNLLLGSPDPAVTAHSLAAHESLFRIAMFADLVTATIDIFLALALYRLLNGVDHGLAVVMVILGLMSTPIYFVNTAVNDGGALLFARGGELLSAFSRPQQDAMTVLFLHLHHYGTVVNEVFWGLWLLPLGMLVYRSGFLPKFLGVWLIANGFAYVAQDAAGILWPQYADMVANAALPLQFGEIAIMLWLLVIGAREPRSAAIAAPAQER